MDKIQCLVLFFAGFFLLAGCNSETVDDYSSYKMPESYESTVYEIQTQDGYPMEKVVIADPAPQKTDLERWQEWREKVEAQDKYATMRKVWEHENEADFSEREEERIEEYCKEYGYARCKGIDVTCEEDGCHKVIVECDDDFYDEGIDEEDECRKFDVTVEKDIDDGLTQAHEAEES